MDENMVTTFLEGISVDDEGMQEEFGRKAKVFGSELWNFFCLFAESRRETESIQVVENFYLITHLNLQVWVTERE